MNNKTIAKVPLQLLKDYFQLLLSIRNCKSDIKYENDDCVFGVEHQKQT